MQAIVDTTVAPTRITIIERARRPDKKDPGIDNPTKSPDLTPKAPSIIINTSIIAAITLF